MARNVGSALRISPNAAVTLSVKVFIGVGLLCRAVSESDEAKLCSGVHRFGLHFTPYR